jgi:hypothetical protein
MTREEDLIRATTSAIASTVSDVPPLRLAPATADPAEAARFMRRARGARRLRGWLAPVTAAAVVLLIAAALVIIRDIPNGRVVPPITSASPSTAGVPKYYAAPETVCSTCQSTRLVVGDTFTGAKLATFTPPHGTTFVAASAAADDRTFVVDTVEFPFNVETQHVTWYLLKITPGASTPVRLTRLRIPATPAAAMIGTVVLSPSGRELAVTYRFRHAMPMTTVLRIYSVATGGLLHSWSTDTAVALGPFDFTSYVQSNNQLTWVDGDRALSFSTSSNIGNGLFPSAIDVAVRTLDVTTAGGDLIRDSRVVWSMRIPAGRSGLAEPLCVADAPPLTSNGKAVVCDGITGGPGPGGGIVKTRYAWRLVWGTYETSAPKTARILYKFTAHATENAAWGSSASVQWVDGSGSTMIIAWSIASQVTHFGVISHGKLTPLPSPPGITLGTPPEIAW